MSNQTANVSNVVTNPTSMYITNATTTSGIATTGWSGVQFIPYKQPRKPRQKRVVPLFTFYLEEKLNKCLGKKVNRVLKNLTKKCQTKPHVASIGDLQIYTFDVTFSYYTQHHTPIITALQPSLPITPTPPERVDKRFYVKLTVDVDENLKEYEFTMCGRK